LAWYFYTTSNCCMELLNRPNKLVLWPNKYIFKIQVPVSPKTVSDDTSRPFPCFLWTHTHTHNLHSKNNHTENRWCVSSVIQTMNLYLLKDELVWKKNEKNACDHPTEPWINASILAHSRRNT
jgi:hypothetical protein